MSDPELRKLLEEKYKKIIKEFQQPKKKINKPIKLNFKNFNDIINSNEIVVVDFYADWCRPCKIMEPIIEELANKYQNIIFGKINVDEEIELSQNFNIMSIPTFIIFKKGKPVHKIIGAFPKYEFERILNMYL